MGFEVLMIYGCDLRLLGQLLNIFLSFSLKLINESLVLVLEI